MSDTMRVTTTTTMPTPDQVVRFLQSHSWKRTDNNTNFSRWLSPDEKVAIIAGPGMKENMVALLVPKLAKWYGVETLDMAQHIKGGPSREEIANHMIFELVSMLNYETNVQHRQIAEDALRLVGFDDDHIRLFFEGEIVSFGNG